MTPKGKNFAMSLQNDACLNKKRIIHFHSHVKLLVLKRLEARKCQDLVRRIKSSVISYLRENLGNGKRRRKILP